MQERLAEITAERAAKKLAAHQAAEQKLKEAAMPPRMQLAAQVEYVHCHMTLLMHCAFMYAACSMTWSVTHIALDCSTFCQVIDVLTEGKHRGSAYTMQSKELQGHVSKRHQYYNVLCPCSGDVCSACAMQQI